MSGDRSTPRFEVVASTRRSWSRARKLALVAEIGVGDTTVSEVARRHGIHTSLLFRWRRDLEPAARPEAHGTAPARPAAPRPALGFMPVMLAPPKLSPPSAPSPQPKAGVIEIELAGGRIVRVAADVDTTALLRLVAALENAVPQAQSAGPR